MPRTSSSISPTDWDFKCYEKTIQKNGFPCGGTARKDRAVLLDGGDIYQGNTMSNLLEGDSLSAAYMIMGYDAVTIGNHEFDWMIGNTVDADGREMPVKIAVIGFAGSYGSSIKYDHFTGLGYSIRPDYDGVNALAVSLEESGQCDATILLAHEDAYIIAGGIGEGSAVDLILGGHMHKSQKGRTADGLWYLEPACYGNAFIYAELAFEENSGHLTVDKTSYYINGEYDEEEVKCLFLQDLWYRIRRLLFPQWEKAVKTR